MPGEGQLKGEAWVGGEWASALGLSIAPPHRQAGHHELAERLVECQYELTDRLAFYLCGRKPGEQSPGRLGWTRQVGPRHTLAAGPIVTKPAGEQRC